MKKIFFAIICMATCFLQCCAFVSVPLFRLPQPLQEKTLQGKGKHKILLVDISGIITAQEQRSLSGLATEPSSVARIKEELEKAASDKRVKALILRINSPGGTVTASDIIYREIAQFKQKENIFVMACLMDVAASGGYYIANAADMIIAHPTTVTGSIGVIALKFNIKGLIDKVGIEEESIKSGSKKDILSPFRGITEEERRIMQDIIDGLHQQFITVLDQGRRQLSAEDIIPLADGRVFTAAQACEYKLIDGIGYLDDTIEMTKKHVGVQDARVITYYRPMDYKNNIYSQATINLFSLGDRNLLEYLPVRFMYLWNP